MGYLPAGSSKKVRADKYGVRRSVQTELLSKKKQKDGKLIFKCCVVRNNDKYMLLAKILRNDSSLHVMSPGVRFVMADGDTVVLKPERDAACCSNWADGRWYNTAFKLNEAEVEKLRNADILSVTVPFYGGEISRNIVSGKEKAVAEQLRSVGED